MTRDWTPCPGCPWRRDVPPGGSDIPNFDIDLMRGLRSTVGEGDGFRKVMACHHSKTDEEFACRGYVAVEGWHNLQVRILASEGVLDLNAIIEACENLDLYPDFETMLADYERCNNAD